MLVSVRSYLEDRDFYQTPGGLIEVILQGDDYLIVPCLSAYPAALKPPLAVVNGVEMNHAR